MRFVAGRGAVAEKLAGALWRRRWPERCGGEPGRGAVAERHREDETRWVNAAIFANAAGRGKSTLGRAELDSAFVAKTVVGIAGNNKVVYKN